MFLHRVAVPGARSDPTWQYRALPKRRVLRITIADNIGQQIENFVLCHGVEQAVGHDRHSGLGAFVDRALFDFLSSCIPVERVRGQASYCSFLSRSGCLKRTRSWMLPVRPLYCV